MKTLILLSSGLTIAFAPLMAQDTPQPPSRNSEMGIPPWKNNGKKQGPFAAANLTPEERDRIAAAREKANEDPTVRSLREARDKLGEQLADAMRAAMLSADPTLAPALDKIKEARERAKKMKEKFRSLSPEQKQQLKAARQKAKDDPSVQAAREKLRDAQGHDAKRAAARDLHQAMRAAMLKSDPSLGSLLDQIGPPGSGGPDGPPPDMDGPMGEPGME